MADGLNGHFLDDVFGNMHVVWDFLNDGVGDGNLGGSEVRGGKMVGIGVSSISSIEIGGSQGGSGQDFSGSGGLISGPLPSGFSGLETWDGVSEMVNATGFNEFGLEALDFKFYFIGDIFQ